jgi:hypothetical protein
MKNIQKVDLKFSLWSKFQSKSKLVDEYFRNGINQQTAFNIK